MRTSFVQLAKRLKTPRQVQKFLRSFPYNREQDKETLRSAAAVLQVGRAHCFEAALLAAATLELRGYSPLLLSLDSADDLDHVLFVFQQNGRWGAIARSRDEGLHGRPPRYRSLRDLAWSYFDPYVDATGRIKGYRLFNLEEIGVDWRWSKKNLWKIDQYRIGLSHTKMRSSQDRYEKLLRAYHKFGPAKRKGDWW